MHCEIACYVIRKRKQVSYVFRRSGKTDAYANFPWKIINTPNVGRFLYFSSATFPNDIIERTKGTEKTLYCKSSQHNVFVRPGYQI